MATTVITAVPLKPLQVIVEVSRAQESGAHLEIIPYFCTDVGEKKHSRFSPYTLLWGGGYQRTIPNRNPVAARGLMLRGDVSIGRKFQITVSMKPGAQN